MPKKSKIDFKTGLTKLDTMIGGFKGGDFIVVGSRPSMGKTAFLHNIINQTATEHKKKSAVLYLMFNESLIEARFRLSCSNTRVDLYKASRWQITPKEFKRLKQSDRIFSKLPVYFDCRFKYGISELSKALKEWAKKDIKLIVIDGLELNKYLSSDERQNFQYLTKVCACLKKMAKQLNVPIILSCHVPQTAESRKPEIPWLRDLRSEGNIEKYADKIIFLYREEYYRPTNMNLGVTKILVARNHNARIWIVDVKFVSSHCRFDDI